MSYEMKDKAFSLFKNKEKKQENWPDFQGKLMLNGQLYWVSAWSRKTDQGEVYLSGVIKEAIKKDVPATADEFLNNEPQQQPESTDTIPQDDLPF